MINFVDSVLPAPDSPLHDESSSRVSNESRRRRKRKKRRISPDDDALVLHGPRERVVCGISNGKDVGWELSDRDSIILFHGIQPIEPFDGAVWIHSHKNVSNIGLWMRKCKMGST